MRAWASPEASGDVQWRNTFYDLVANDRATIESNSSSAHIHNSLAIATIIGEAHFRLHPSYIV